MFDNFLMLKTFLLLKVFVEKMLYTFSLKLRIAFIWNGNLLSSLDNSINSSKQIFLILLNGSVIHYVLTLKSEEGEGLLDWQGAVLSKHWICVQPRRDCCRGNITTGRHWDDFWITFEGVKIPFLWRYVSHWTTLILNLFIEDERLYLQ